MTKPLTIPGYGTRILHFNSWTARLLKPGGINNCFSPNATDIYISRNWIQGMGLAHEWGHGEDAKERGWKYLPWVLWGYLRHGYATSPAEVRADAFMNAHWRDFPAWVTA